MSKSIELWNVDIVGIHKGDPELTLLCLGPNLTFSLNSFKEGKINLSGNIHFAVKMYHFQM